jgi:hypothetical protein
MREGLVASCDHCILCCGDLKEAVEDGGEGRREGGHSHKLHEGILVITLVMNTEHFNLHWCPIVHVPLLSKTCDVPHRPS